MSGWMEEISMKAEKVRIKLYDRYGIKKYKKEIIHALLDMVLNDEEKLNELAERLR